MSASNRTAAKFRSALKILAWVCCRPWEIAWVATLLSCEQALASKRGGKVRVLARSGGLGDVLWAAAAARMAAECSPRDRLVFLTPPSMAEAVRLAAPGIKIILTHLPNPYMQSLLRCGFEVLDLAYETDDTEGTHMVQTYLRQLGCSQDPREYRWHFEQSPDPRASLPLACLYAGPSWAVREVPLTVWQSVVKRLQDDLGLRVLQVLPDGCSEKQVPGCDGFLTGRPLAELCNLFNQSALVITIDSIMLHLAAGTNAPLIGVFGPTLPSCRLFVTPRRRAVSARLSCTGCHHRLPRLHWESGCHHDIACMQQINAEMLIAAAALLLTPAYPPP
jgi:ADP-heptose:LPS heptosyltransferase